MKPIAPHPPLKDFYGEASKREAFVRDIFDETAPWYDWAISFMSFGSGDWYRKDALTRNGLAPGMKVLDLATGTGVVARAAASVTKDPKAIAAVDPSIGMLTAGKISSPRAGGAAEHLPFKDASFDMITIGFALRHFADLSIVFNDCRRVLRPGGRLLILEITAPESKLGRGFLGFYMGKVVPLGVRLRTRNPRAEELFRYYWETTRDCVRPEVILSALAEAGFRDGKRHVELGIFSEYSGVVG